MLCTTYCIILYHKHILRQYLTSILCLSSPQKAVRAAGTLRQGDPATPDGAHQNLLEVVREAGRKAELLQTLLGNRVLVSMRDLATANAVRLEHRPFSMGDLGCWTAVVLLQMHSRTL
jgi:hypothetical protein